MRHLLNTLFVLSEDAYLALDGENVVVNRSKAEVSRRADAHGYIRAHADEASDEAAAESEVRRP